jgi:hypothetical protein
MPDVVMLSFSDRRSRPVRISPIARMRSARRDERLADVVAQRLCGGP